jgi:hypothetical protein
MDINTVTEGLNDICVETGVCAPTVKTTFLTAEVSKDAKIIYAAELYKDGSKRVVRVACFDDKCVSSCVLEDGKTPAPCCHTSSSGGIELTKAWIEHLKSNGYRVKEVPVEE